MQKPHSLKCWRADDSCMTLYQQYSSGALSRISAKEVSRGKSYWVSTYWPNKQKLSSTLVPPDTVPRLEGHVQYREMVRRMWRPSREVNVSRKAISGSSKSFKFHARCCNFSIDLRLRICIRPWSSGKFDEGPPFQFQKHTYLVLGATLLPYSVLTRVVRYGIGTTRDVYFLF